MPPSTETSNVESSSRSLSQKNELQKQQQEQHQEPSMKNKQSASSFEDEGTTTYNKKMRTKSVDTTPATSSSSSSSSDDDSTVSASSPTNIIRFDDEDRPSRRQRTPLPDPNVHMDPDDYLAKLVTSICGFTPKPQKAISLTDGYFPDISEERISAYDMQLVVACRENDVATLRRLHDTKSVDCCNRFGESLLHMACRRGFQEIVTFLLQDAGLSVRIRDDCGRTPFHDACWNPTPQLEICELLLRRDPSLLLITDKRNSTPFQYARPQDWATWRHFLHDHCEDLLVLAQSKDVFS